MSFDLDQPATTVEDTDAPVGPAFDDPDSEWLIEDNHKEVRLRTLTAVLLGLLIAASGFWGGAALQKHHTKAAPVAASASAAAAARAAFAGGAARAGIATGAGATPPATSGLVTEVQGNTVYITDDTGALVKVTLTPTTTITRTSNSADGGLITGDTAVVRGTKGADGTIAATSITATAQGVAPATSSRSGAGGNTGVFGG